MPTKLAFSKWFFGTVRPGGGDARRLAIERFHHPPFSLSFSYVAHNDASSVSGACLVVVRAEPGIFSQMVEDADFLWLPFQIPDDATPEQIRQRWKGIADDPLNAHWTGPQLVAFRNKAQTLGFDTTGLVGSSTVREVIERMIQHTQPGAVLDFINTLPVPTP